MCISANKQSGESLGPDTVEITLAINGEEQHLSIDPRVTLLSDEHDSVVNDLQIKGLGEIGTIGSAAAIANAVYHATGKRVRNLPITPDKLLDAQREAM